MTDNKLKSISDRINRLLDERDGINGDISDLYQEAKSDGYIPKVLRKAIARMRMDQNKRAEEDSILELYEGALDGKTRAVIDALKSGSTLDATAEQTGTSRRTVARISKTVPKNSENGTAAKADVISPPEVADLSLADQSAPALPPKHADAVGAVLDAMASGDEMPPIPDFLRRVPA